MSVDLRGKATNNAASPKVGLTVELYEAATWEAAGAATTTTTTDADGLWAFDAQDATKTWIPCVIDGTKKFLIDARNRIQLTKIDLITLLQTDTINEHTSATGVTVDGLLIKDSGATFQDDTLKIQNPAATFNYTLVGAAITAARQLNLPLITGTDTLAALGLAQTWTAVQTLNSPVFVTPALGTPASGVMTNVTGLPTAGLVDAAVTLAKMANLAQDQFIGRVTASTGVPETATITAAARTVLDDTTVAAMVDTLGGAAATGTGGLARATSPTFVTPALGTPASGVLTNCTGLPAASVVAGSFGAGAFVISTSLQAATIELGHATDTTLSRVSAGIIAVEGITVVLLSGAQTLTDKTLTSPILTTPALGTPASGVMTNVTGLPAAAILAGSFGAGAYVISTTLTVPTIVGGSATTADLTLKTTSGVGEAGADMHFLVGNNGATEAMTILNNGYVGIGIAAPLRTLHVVGLCVISAAAATADEAKGLSLGINNNDSQYSFEINTNGYVTNSFAITPSTLTTGVPVYSTPIFLITAGGNVGIGVGSNAPGALLDLGLAGTTAGVVRLAGGTSGNVTIAVAAAAGTWTMTLPTGAGTSGYFLATDGAGVTSWSNTLTAPAINGTVTTTGLTFPTWTLNSNGIDILFSSYKGANSDGNNIFIGGGGQSSVGAIGETHKGSQNTALGVSALSANTTGYYNTALGVNTLSANTTGYYNAALGVSALGTNTTGYYNTALGLRAGNYIADAATSNETSTTSLYLGAITRALADGDANEIVIGYNTTGLGSNTVVLGNSDITTTVLRGSVGIGNTAPGALLDLGLAGTTAGVVRLAGLTSGNVTVAVAAAAGTWTMTLPTGVGTAGYFLATDGAGVTSWSNTLTAPAINGTVTTTGLTMPALIAGSITTNSTIVLLSNQDNSSREWRSGTDDASPRILLFAKNYAGTPGRIEIRGPNAALADRIILGITGAVAVAAATWGDVYHIGMKFGLAGTATGAWTMDGATSGVVTMTVAAAAGTWTMTLPTGVAGVGGYQLTDAAGDGVTSWSGAGSLREYKNILGLANPQDALDAILGTRAYRFHYKPGMGTGDSITEYVGVMADEAPWAMHYNGGVVNPVNALGFSILGIQALNAKIEALEKRLAELQKALA